MNKKNLAENILQKNHQYFLFLLLKCCDYQHAFLRQP